MPSRTIDPVSLSPTRGPAIDHDTPPSAATAAAAEGWPLPSRTDRARRDRRLTLGADESEPAQPVPLLVRRRNGILVPREPYHPPPAEWRDGTPATAVLLRSRRAFTRPYPRSCVAGNCAAGGDTQNAAFECTPGEDWVVRSKKCFSFLYTKYRPGALVDPLRPRLSFNTVRGACFELHEIRLYSRVARQSGIVIASLEPFSRSDLEAWTEHQRQRGGIDPASVPSTKGWTVTPFAPLGDDGSLVATCASPRLVRHVVVLMHQPAHPVPALIEVEHIDFFGRRGPFAVEAGSLA
ncbi:hypothetical protein H9P43_007683 [Blastocladiella emersonii ATCC 22665]|nr:hypothetical protein H9P43_007683 [Blastocladiella emersonii ATCC 22665]